MATTGVIFAAIVIAWLAYLVPHYVRRHEDRLVQSEPDPAERFADSARIIRRGSAPLLDQDLSPIGAYEVSTPLTRRAAVHDLRRLERLAAARRRRVLLVLFGLVGATIAAALAGVLGWGWVAAPAVLMLAFVVLARFSVVAMHRDLDARHAAIQRGSEESTVVLRRPSVRPSRPAEPESRVATAALWDPVPITMPTYVSKPLAPRTVRTIDLSGPGVPSSVRPGPVTADAPEPVAPGVRRDEEGGSRQVASA